MYARRPLIVVSKCLGFAACRYDGTRADDAVPAELRARCRCLAVCPELELGLGCPRPPVRVLRAAADPRRDRLVQPATGRDLTAAVAAFARRFLDSLPPVAGFVLKSRSPCCGPDDAKVFAAAEDEGAVTRDAGFFARAVRERMGGVPLQSERALRDPGARARFLDEVFRRTSPVHERRR